MRFTFAIYDDEVNVKPVHPHLVAMLLCVIVVSSNTGCCFKRGDATLLICPALIGRSGDRTYRLSLPSVSLGKCGVTRFRVRDFDLPSPDYDLVMPLPRISQDESFGSKGRPPTWAPAIVNLRFLSPGGRVIAEKRYDLGASIADFDWPDDGQWQMSLGEMNEIKALHDYDVEVQIIVPSGRRQDWAELRASGSYNVYGAAE